MPTVSLCEFSSGGSVKTLSKLLLSLLLIALLISLPMPALADGENKPPVALPSWLQVLLQWLGLDGFFSSPSSTPAAPTPTPVSALPEYRMTRLEELEAFWRQLKPGQRVRVWVAASDVQSILSAWLNGPAARKNGVQSATLSLGDGFIQGSVTMERAFLEKQGFSIPFVRGEWVEIAGEVAFQVGDCRPLVRVQKITVNGSGFPLALLVEQMLNQTLSKEWPAQLCLDSLTISPEKIVVEGARR
jgi:hypothetical protein